MPRGRKLIKKREILPDLKYQDIRVAKFINYICKRGKKSLAQKIVYQSFDLAAKKIKKPAVEIFEKALENAGPLLEVRSTRIGGATYQVPYEVPQGRRFTLAARWIVEAAFNKQGKPMAEFLAEEIIAAYNNEGTAVKKKLDTHKMAEANKAFAHFARM
ncbi:MAG: 30S ribosomal protein S7 [Candidatus Berkelbacteria bacterium]|nr:30S ribosomal protein S7 [Candidatus Berkelbacteria bacterium]